ncbi:MAG TPA: PAC2 family protein [Actinocrinis sp.]|uniref:PAC2 family protein n=1 Tax=Actinocrinis sp. TaxID=1920516 RepID=UPI002DDDB84F|nr:PAC2 family protein [Actinocrinis sp.]HEV3170505.1 PAC2 family protein [Actinocrinis sp.]
MGEPQGLYELDQAGMAALAEARGREGSGGTGVGGLVLLYHFEGFMDAGHAAEQVMEHVLGDSFALDGDADTPPSADAEADPRPGHPVVVRFDADRLVDYRAQRPSMTFDTDHWAEYEAPEITVRLARDATGTPFLVLYGPEPDTEWEKFATGVVQVIDELGVTLAVNFHGIPFAVPHTRPTTLIPHGNRPDLMAGHPKWFDRAQVPGSAMALVEYRLSEKNRAVLGLAAQIPHYISRSPYPAAAVRILEAVTAATGLVLPAQELHEQAERVTTEIDVQVTQGDDELRSMIHGLEVQYDAVAGASPRSNLLAEQAARLPTAEELARQFEQFLAEQDRDGDR